MPWDRTWAIAHEGAKTDGTAWAPCANFSRGAKAPALMAIDASLDEASEQITLTHPDRPDVTLHPEKDAAELIEWVEPLMPKDRAQSARVIRVPGRGMTDTDFPSISIANLASNAAVGDVEAPLPVVEKWQRLLKSWNHQDFGIYATVSQGGDIRLGDTVRVL